MLRRRVSGAARRVLLSAAASCLILAAYPVDSDAAAARFRIYFARDDGDGRPAAEATEHFDCSDKVYGVLEAKGLAAGVHTLEVRWYDPSGRRRERTRYDFYATRAETRVWAWLKLYRPAGAILDRMLLMDRAAGMEDMVGTWKVKFYVDGKLVEKRSFTVYC